MHKKNNCYGIALWRANSDLSGQGAVRGIYIRMKNIAIIQNIGKEVENE